MEIYRNHCWCSNSNWGFKTFDCSNLLTIRKYDNENSNRNDNPCNDWDKTVQRKRVVNQEAFSMFKEMYGEDSALYPVEPPMITISTLKDEVIDWLNENVADRKEQEVNKGWAVYQDEYNTNPISSVSIFFHRKSDALKFIRYWSEHKKPTVDFNYFEDLRKKLNLETNKLEIIE